MSDAVKKAAQAVGLGLAGTAVALTLSAMGLLERFEGVTWDWRSRLDAGLSPATREDPILLIVVDQYSLDWAQDLHGWGWPWPREVWGVLAGYCRSGGAKSVTYDILFTDSPHRYVGVDQQFGNALAEASHIAMAAFFGESTGNRTNWPAWMREPRLQVEDGADTLFPVNRRASFPVPQIATNTTLLGNVRAEGEAGGVFRRLHPLHVFDGRPVATLGLAAALAGGPGAMPVRIGIRDRTVAVGDWRTIPIDDDGKAVLRYPDPRDRFQKWTAASVLQSVMNVTAGDTNPTVRAEAFRDAHVLVGLTAPGLLDLKPTPLNDKAPGLEVHATFLANLLDDRFMRPVSPMMSGLFGFLLIGAAAASIRFGGKARHNLSAAVVFLLLPGGAATAFHLGGWVWPWVWPTLGSAISIGGAVIWNYATEGRQKLYIKSAFKHYLSPDVIEKLLEDPDRLALGGERRELTIFFSDLEGFSSIAERMSPSELTSFLNEYLTAMTDIILEEGGTLDKYEGDAILAFWNAPLDQPDHAARACRAAARCEQALDRLNPGWRNRTGVPVRMRIGIHSGEVIVGNMGSGKRFDYTILGDAANVASRLEGANKLFGSRIMISSLTRNYAGDAVTARMLGGIQVVGRRDPVYVFEVLGLDTAAVPEWIESWNEGLRHVGAGRWAQAVPCFEACGDDAAARLYAERCRDLANRADGRWDGIWVLDQK